MTKRPSIISQHRRLLGAALAIGALAGCAAHTPPKVDEERVKQLAGRGYSGDEHFSIATTHHSWAVGNLSFDIALAVPTSVAGAPLVIYLPGLGETRSAGEAWRTAWAQAGYAVLAVQLLPDDQKAWSSTAARRGDFDTLARERYSAAAAAARGKALAMLMSELAKRRSVGEAVLEKIDLSRIAIAGYDIGAYSTMLAAGEMPKAGSTPTSFPLAISAVIALSPYADFSGAGFSTRYQAITGPVLSISGEGDADALGAVASPSVRKAPFENMPSKDAYLLWLAKANHAVMAGGAETAVDERGGFVARQQGEYSAPQQGGTRNRRGGGKESHSAGMEPSGGRGTAFSPTDRAMDIELIRGVTTAFLDAYVRKDPIAAEWLHKNARRWIGERGTWQYK
jgi:dienelactone hydrolase